LKTHGQFAAAKMRVHYRASPQDGRQSDSAPHPTGTDDQVVADPAQAERPGIDLRQL
jgi:hypothetical protein